MKKLWIKDYKDAGLEKNISKDIVDWNSTGFTKEEMVSHDFTVFVSRDTKNMRINKNGYRKMTGATTSIDIEHGLGYVPVVIAAAYIGGSTAISNRWVKLPYFVNDGVTNPEIRLTINKNNLTLFRNFTSVDVSFYYYLFREKIDGG